MVGEDTDQGSSVIDFGILSYQSKIPFVSAESLAEDSAYVNCSINVRRVPFRRLGWD